MDHLHWERIRPIGTRALVKLDGKRDKVGSLYIPDACQKQPQSATVVAVGSRCPPELQPGVRVYVGKYNGVEVPAPVHDPEGSYWMVECDHSQPVPHCPDVYGVLDVEAGEDVRERTSSDLHAMSIGRRTA